MVAGAPETQVVIPPPVRILAAGRSVRPVWKNELGGLTFEIGAGPDRWFVKWSPTGNGIDLRQEWSRLIWTSQFTNVPQVVEWDEDEAGTWMVTAALPGESAVAARWRADPSAAVAAIGEGLRQFHEALPTDRCPFTWSVQERLEHVQREADAGRLQPERWNADLQHLTVADALELLSDIPAIDELVVCHGDSCAPNTLITEDGRCSGHVDLGSLGTGDRWADLAIATWSTGWNYGPGWEGALLSAYGVDPDAERTFYYRLLWELGP